MKVKPVKMSGNVYLNWKNFIDDFKRRMASPEFFNKREELKLQFLLDDLGDEGIKIYKEFQQSVKESSAEGELLQNVFSKFEEYFSSFKNIQNFNLFMFNERQQKEDESFEDFLKDVEELAGYCNFGPVKKKYLKGKIISGISDKTLQRKFLTMDDPTLDQIIERCKALDKAKAMLKAVMKDETNIFVENNNVTENDVEQNEMENKVTNNVKDDDVESNVETPQLTVNIKKLNSHDAPDREENPGPSSTTKDENLKNGKKEDDVTSNDSIVVLKVKTTKKKQIFQCFKCDKCYVNEGFFKNHLLTKHNRRSSYKGKRFSPNYYNSERIDHLKMKIKKEYEPDIYTCDECGKKFHFKNTLKDHIASHFDDKPFTCNKCENKFSTKSEFIKHIGRKH